MTAQGVFIREVALRDGLQSEDVFVPTKEKLELVRALRTAGIKYLETTSFVSPRAVPQLEDAAELMAGVPRKDLIHEVMVPNLKGAQAALNAGADRLVVFVSASESHNRANVGQSIERSMAELESVVQLAQERGVPTAAAIAVSFGCPYEGRVPFAKVLEISGALVQAGVDRVSLADTAGMAEPVSISEKCAAVSEHLPETGICLHLHNNRGVAMANLYAGYLAGVRMFDTSLGGIGGCPNIPRAAGNLATEDVAYLFEAMGVATGLDHARLLTASSVLERLLAHPLFAHTTIETLSP
jgi:hydroxymethylglutaryl-CoA lyase